MAVDLKEGFADEEDYIKAGGSELLFVQMQQKKSMEKQSKLADKVVCMFVFIFVHFFLLISKLNFIKEKEKESLYV